MAYLRRLLVVLLELGIVCVVLGAVGVTLGTVNWGDGGWYYHRSPDYRLRAGQEALRQGDPDRAERIALALETAGFADHAALLRGELLFRRGQALANAGDLKRGAPFLVRAVDQFEKIQERGSLRREAAEFYGLAALALGQRHEAERGLRYVLDEAPNAIDAHRGLAALYYDQGALTSAIQHLQRVAELDPEDGRPYRFMGHIYKDLEQNAEAIEAFRQALGRSLGAAFAEDVKENLAEVLVKHSDYQDALQILASSTPQAADVPKLLALRARCLWALQQVADARSVLDRALAEHASSVELLRLRGEIFLQENEPQKAAELLERALSFDRHEQTSRQLLAQAYAALGKTVEAAEQKRLAGQTQEYLHQMTQLSREAMTRPWDAAVRKQLAEVCDHLDRPELAAMWRQAAGCCPAPGP
jgi:tetratricopeptide (TPR) repeat protein